MPKTKLEEQSLFSAAPLPQMALDDAPRLACLRPIRSENVGPVAFRELINHYGGTELALEALPELAGRGGKKRGVRITSKADAERELDRAAKAGATLIFTVEPGYPLALAAIEALPQSSARTRSRTRRLSRRLGTRPQHRRSRA